MKKIDKNAYRHALCQLQRFATVRQEAQAQLRFLCDVERSGVFFSEHALRHTCAVMDEVLEELFYDEASAALHTIEAWGRKDWAKLLHERAYP